MKIKKLIVGQLQTNCYLLTDEDQCLIIDPGDDADYIISTTKDLEVKPIGLLATHGHFDHLLSATELKLAFDIPFYLHKDDLPILKRTESTAKYFTGLSVDPPPSVDKYLKKGQILKVGKCELKIIETPGHTPGGISLYSSSLSRSTDGDNTAYPSSLSRSTDGDNTTYSSSMSRSTSSRLTSFAKTINPIVFVGDLMFAGGGVGRTDLQGGNTKLLNTSVKKILSLPKDTVVYSGHGEETAVEKERKFFK